MSVSASTDSTHPSQFPRRVFAGRQPEPTGEMTPARGTRNVTDSRPQRRGRQRADPTDGLQITHDSVAARH